MYIIGKYIPSIDMYKVMFVTYDKPVSWSDRLRLFKVIKVPRHDRRTQELYYDNESSTFTIKEKQK